MRSTALRVMLVIFHGVLVTSSADAANDARPALVVRTYAAAPIDASTWMPALHAASALLDEAGIRVEWVHCSALRADTPESGPARCTMPSARNEVVLRIVNRPPVASRDPLLLGDSWVDASLHLGTLATIYLDHVDSLARDAGVRSETVMARAMAHELGHLLLGTNTHSAHGLMRPAWRPGDLARNRPEDWTIAAADGARMRLALNRRMALRRDNATN